MKPNPTKVPALQELPIPDNQSELQSFLGLSPTFLSQAIR